MYARLLNVHIKWSCCKIKHLLVLHLPKSLWAVPDDVPKSDGLVQLQGQVDFHVGGEEQRCSIRLQTSSTLPLEGSLNLVSDDASLSDALAGEEPEQDFHADKGVDGRLLDGEVLPGTRLCRAH